MVPWAGGDVQRPLSEGAWSGRLAQQIIENIGDVVW